MNKIKKFENYHYSKNINENLINEIEEYINHYGIADFSKHSGLKEKQTEQLFDLIKVNETTSLFYQAGNGRINAWKSKIQ